MQSTRLAQQQFDRLDEVWRQVKTRHSFYYQIGPFTLCLCFANQAFADGMTRAFHHLAIAAAKADLTICMIDTTQEDQQLPPLNWNLINYNGYRGYFDLPIFLHYFPSISALSVLSVQENKAYYVVRSAALLPWWVNGSPLQVILHAWFREQGLQLTHTAAVGTETAAILMTGKGGSGKSTTTLSCLAQGLYSVGEDYCLLKPGSEPHAYSVYQSAKLEKNTRTLFPDYERFIVNTEAAKTEKALMYYEDLFPGQIKKALPVRAIMSLSVGGGPLPLMQTQDKQAALQDLMMSTLAQLPFYHPKTLEILKEVVDQVPCFRLELGRNITANVDVIRDILK